MTATKTAANVGATRVTKQGKQQLPLAVELAGKRDMRTQFGALCYRIVKNKAQVLLITSRRTKRWVIPKGWPMQGKTPGDSALQEAWEEAGVIGKVTGPCLALYTLCGDGLSSESDNLVRPLSGGRTPQAQMDEPQKGRAEDFRAGAGASDPAVRRQPHQALGRTHPA